MFDLTGKTALVTGASGGIGGAIAQALHAAGATVALSGTRVQPLEDLAASLGSRAHVLACNLSDVAEVEGLVKRAAEAMGLLMDLSDNDLLDLLLGRRSPEGQLARDDVIQVLGLLRAARSTVH